MKGHRDEQLAQVSVAGISSQTASKAGTFHYFPYPIVRACLPQGSFPCPLWLLSHMCVPLGPTPHGVYEDRKERKGRHLKNSLHGPAGGCVSTLESMYMYV